MTGSPGRKPAGREEGGRPRDETLYSRDKMRASAHAGSAALALAVALGAATPARAQFWPEITEKQKQGRFRIGPVALTPRLELKNAGVDTNVFVAPTDPVADTSIVLRASSDVFVPAGRRVRLAGTAWLDFNYFASESDQRSTDPGAQGRIEVDAWRLTFVAGGGAFNSRQLYSSDIDQRVKRNEKWLNGGFRLRLTSQLRLEAGVEDHRYRWNPTPEQDTAIADQLDHDSTVWKGALRYKITPLTDLVASAETIDDTFLVAPMGLATTTSHRYLGGFEFGEKAFITGRFLGGVRTIPEGNAGSVAPYTGPAFQAAIVVPFLKRLRLNITYDRDVYYSATGGLVAEGLLRNTYTYSRLGASLDIDAPLDLVLRLTGGYDDAKYLRPYPVAGDRLIDRRDQLYLRGVSLLRRIGDHALLGLTALYSRRASSYPGADYTRWQYGVQGSINP